VSPPNSVIGAAIVSPSEYCSKSTESAAAGTAPTASRSGRSKANGRGMDGGVAANARPLFSL
jgi:hypothetical protein